MNDEQLASKRKDGYQQDVIGQMGVSGL